MCGDIVPCAPPTPVTSLLQASDAGSEPFHCLICLDLIYKPIVQPCGHAFCFWCVRRSMNAKRQSQCPACRRPYMHFPRVCESLHFFLMKAWPQEYSRRASEILAMEESMQVFSPRIIPESPLSSGSPRKPNDLTGTTLRQSRTSPTVWFREAQSPIPFSDSHDFCSRDCDEEELACSGRGEADFASLQHESKAHDESSAAITVHDFSCASCYKLSYRPVVLNCGEVFCESCFKTSTDSSSNFVCPSCRTRYPPGSIHVFLELHHFLEKVFPICYLERKKEIEHLQQETNEDWQAYTGATSDSENESWDDHEPERPYVHIGVGCDGCGMFPILGHRYHCKDCMEQTGYDLCGNCHRGTISATPCGRFRQQHAPDHRMEEVVSDFRSATAAPLLNFNLQNGLIISRRRELQLLDDFDDYIDSLV